VLGRRLDVERAAVRLCNRARDEEAEAGSRLGAAAAGSPEFLEDQPLILGRDTRPVVGDLDPDDAVVRARVDPHLTAGARVFDRVVDEVLDELVQPVPVAADRRQRAFDPGLEAYLVLAEGGGRDDLRDDRAEVHVAEREAERAGLDP
jgi:hypothetical protein